MIVDYLQEVKALDPSLTSCSMDMRYSSVYRREAFEQRLDLSDRAEDGPFN